MVFMSYKLSDNVIGRIAQIVQEGLLLGVDVVDLMRQIEVEPVNSVDGPPAMELTVDYRRRVDEHHKKLVEEAESLQAKRAESASILFDS
jgi:hypothetical protein